MKRCLLPIIALAALCATADACPPQAFSLGYCQPYVAPVYAAPIVSYAQPVYAPLQTYSYNAPAQALVLPGKVTYTAPQVTYQLEQVQGYAYAAPVQAYAAPVLKSYAYSAPLAVKSYGYSLGVKAQVQHHHALRIQVNDNRAAAVRIGPLGGSTTVQADGDIVRRGPLGLTRRVIKN